MPPSLLLTIDGVNKMAGFWIGLVIMIALVAFVVKESRRPVRKRGVKAAEACPKCNRAKAHCRHLTRQAETPASFHHLPREEEVSKRMPKRCGGGSSKDRRDAVREQRRALKRQRKEARRRKKRDGR